MESDCCSLCIEEISNNANTVKLDCKHEFHLECLTLYIKYIVYSKRLIFQEHFRNGETIVESILIQHKINFRCPLCRADIPLPQVRKYINTYYNVLYTRYKTHKNKYNSILRTVMRSRWSKLWFWKTPDENFCDEMMIKKDQVFLEMQHVKESLTLFFHVKVYIGCI
jgi:hypothetical protein